jgi:hypothetical protein
LISWEWLGGFVDGEGGFTVIVHLRKSGQLDIRPAFEMAITDLQLMQEIANFLGVKTYPHRPSNSRESDALGIQIKHSKLLQFITSIFPYLNSDQKIKAARLCWIMQWFKSLRTEKRQTLTTVEFLAKLTQKIREINRGKSTYKWGYEEIIEYYRRRVMPPDKRKKIYCCMKRTPQLIEAVKKMRNNGLTFKEIAEKLQIHAKTASRWYRI